MKKIAAALLFVLIVTACGATGIKTTTPETVEETLDSRGSMHESIQTAVEDTSTRDSISVALQVSGGAPAEGYLLNLRISGDGHVTYTYFDKLISDEEYRGEADLQDDEVVALLEMVLESGILELPESEPQFAPGTTVGMLDLADGTSQFQLYFAADAEQAASQGKVPPRELMEFVEALYTLGSDLIIGVESVKP